MDNTFGNVAAVGTCSLCGGVVYGHVGAWWGVVPPPPARCSKCGAIEKVNTLIPELPIIDMVKNAPINYKHYITTGTDISSLTTSDSNITATISNNVPITYTTSSTITLKTGAEINPTLDPTEYLPNY